MSHLKTFSFYDFFFNHFTFKWLLLMSMDDLLVVSGHIQILPKLKLITTKTETNHKWLVSWKI